MCLSSQTGTLAWKEEKNRVPNDQRHAADPQSSGRILSSGSEQVSSAPLIPANSHTLSTSSQARTTRTSPGGNRPSLRTREDTGASRDGLLWQITSPLRPASWMSRPSSPYHLGSTGRAPLACWRGGGLEGDRRQRAMLREVLAIPSKGSGQQPWELRPPHVSLVGRRWLQPEGGSHLPALSSPGIFAPQGPSQGTRQACYMCRRCIQWEKLPERLGRRRGVRVPRGASVWPAAVDATFLENSSSARRGKGRTKNRTKLSRDHQEEAQVETRGLFSWHGNRQDGPMATSRSSVP